MNKRTRTRAFYVSLTWAETFTAVAFGASSWWRSDRRRCSPSAACSSRGAAAGPTTARLAPPGVRPLVFSDKAFGVCCALCDRILPRRIPGRPVSRPDAREARIAERIDQELTFHTPRMQRDVELALLFLEHGGLLHFSTTRFTRLSPEDQDALLQKMIEGVQVEQQASTRSSCSRCSSITRRPHLETASTTRGRRASSASAPSPTRVRGPAEMDAALRPRCWSSTR